MIMKTIIIVMFLLMLFFCAIISYGQQKDTIYGKVKSVREQLFFLDENNQNMKFFSSEGDYGHHGFISPEFTKNRFYSWWYNVITNV